MHSDSERCRIYHGSGVETKTCWFGEIVWDGAFERGNFDLTDHVYGSGGRLRNGKVTFAGSASNVERIYYLPLADGGYVSNSLLALLAASGTRLDYLNDSYHERFYSALQGRKHHAPIPSSRGNIHITYYDNILFDGAFSVVDKPPSKRVLHCFADVETMLFAHYESVHRNATDHRRLHPFKMAATMSQGYDSPCAAAIASRFGLRKGISINQSFQGKDDAAHAIATPLGIELTRIDADAWHRLPTPEPMFIASGAFGEDIHFAPLEAELDNTLLHTGFFGDSIWSRSHTYRDRPIGASDISGTSMGEFRLRAGFICFDVPGLGAANRDQMIDISNSDEMKPWDYQGEYSRPIPRRILESMGVPRDSFGIYKQGASHNLHQRKDFLSEASELDYMRWLAENRLLSAVPLRKRWDDIERWSYRLLERGAYLALRALNSSATQALPVPARAGLQRFFEDLSLLTHTTGKMPKISRYRRYIFGWAISRLLPAYTAPFEAVKHKSGV